MTLSLAARPAPRGPLPWIALGAVLLLWGAGVVAIARAGLFPQPVGQPPLPLLAAVALPVLTGVALWLASPALRAWTAGWDLAALVALQTFRVMGVVFLFFWMTGDLPTLFALVAGLGDIAVGILAIPVTLAVARRTPGWPDRVRGLTRAGLFDFAVVITLAILSQQGNLLHLPGEPTPAFMQSLPMVLVPGYLVPIFILLLLLQARRVRGLA
jgi:hypothetical protein